jgi:hypothetical protein
LKNNTLFFMLVFLSACATQKMEYRPPIKKEYSTVKTINKSFDKVWASLVGKLSTENYTIESVEKNSGLIIISRKMDPPSKYADCGHWEGFYKNLDVNNQYSYAGADSGGYVFLVGLAKVPVVFERETSLKTRSNIYVKKVKSNKTIITVGTHYVLTLKPSYVYYTGKRDEAPEQTVEWTTNEKGVLGKGNLTECYSNYVIERNVLALAE